MIDAKALLTQTIENINVHYPTSIFRDANQCADHLARLGVEQEEPQSYGFG